MNIEQLINFQAKKLFSDAHNKDPFYSIWLEQRHNGKVDIKDVLDKTTLTPSAVNLQMLFDRWEQELEKEILDSEALAVQLFYPLGLNTLESHRIPKDSREEFDLTRMGDEFYKEVDNTFKPVINQFDFMFIHDETSRVLVAQTLLYKQLFFVMPDTFLYDINELTMRQPANYRYESLEMDMNQYLDSYIDYQKISDTCREKSKLWDNWNYKKHHKAIKEFKEAVLSSMELE